MDPLTGAVCRGILLKQFLKNLNFYELAGLKQFANRNKFRKKKKKNKIKINKTVNKTKQNRIINFQNVL